MGGVFLFFWIAKTPGTLGVQGACVETTGDVVAERGIQRSDPPQSSQSFLWASFWAVLRVPFCDWSQGARELLPLFMILSGFCT